MVLSFSWLKINYVNYLCVIEVFESFTKNYYDLPSELIFGSTCRL